MSGTSNRVLQFKMVFSDIDGTLLNSQHQISEPTTAKILELQTRGVPFVLVSARPPVGVRLIQEQIGLAAPMISYSGALVVDQDNKVLSDIALNREVALDIYHCVCSEFPDICCSLYAGEDWIVNDRNNPWVAEEEKIVKSNAKALDIEGYLQQSKSIHKYLLMGEPDSIVKLENRLKEKFSGLTIAMSNPNYLEVMNEQASKSAGVRTLCDAYGVGLHEVLAFGDGMNDIDMLKAVNNSYAMGNAPQSVKDHAAYVTADNDHEGLLRALEVNF